MTDHFDAVVVGSGFGASVMAYRLADQGKAVCVLERGRRYPPGSFPRTPRTMAHNVWEPKQHLFGLFDIWSFRKLEAVVSSGLGGGSLIYANVLLRKDEHWFVRDGDHPGGEAWPITREDLEPDYDAVEKMLGATRYPYADETPKTREFRTAAARIGLEWCRPNLAITFANGGDPPTPGVPIDEIDNLHGRPRLTCQLCGECDLGCNAGSKNTLDYNYLSRAHDKGAVIRTLAEVRRIEPRGGPGTGFSVTYRDHSDAAEHTAPHEPSPEHTVTSDTLVLGAGTFGTTYLLLRNRSAFPHLGPALGTRFSGNGDLLTFLRRSRRRMDGEPPRWLDPSVGPVITSAIRVGDTLDGDGSRGRGFYIEDGGYPQFADWLVEAGGAIQLGARAGAFLARRVFAHAMNRQRSNISADVAGLFNRGIASATTVPILAMGRDVPNGVMSLHHGDLAVDWDTSASEEYFSRVRATIDDLAGALGAKVANWPLWLFKRLITVHPLGGCPMGSDYAQGVVDSYGQAFHYPGLYVVDGSAMPGPVGPNPSLTIAAFANRAATSILDGPR